MAQRLKHLPAMQETRVRSLGWEDSPGEGNGNPLQYSSWRISWMEEPGGLQSTGRKELDTIERLHFTSPWWDHLGLTGIVTTHP